MIAKNIFDFSLSLIGIIILWPILLVIYLCIKIFMPDGPCIFQQKRIGKNGTIFTMYKFRTMYTNHNGCSISVKGERRITPLGSILRRFKLDELPELWNVLIGDMSFVGPRPDVPGYADKLSEDDKILLSIRPGITSPASLKYINEEELLAKQKDPIRYNNEVIWPDKVRININYIKKRTLLIDLKIIFYTILGKNINNDWAN